MEQQDFNNPQNPGSTRTQTANSQNTIKNKTTTGPRFVAEKSKPNYYARLFSGRMNRQNYIIGSTILVLIPLICFLVVIFSALLSPSALAMPYIDPNNPGNIVIPNVSITSLLITPSNELWIAIGTLFIILSLPYLLSIQVRRLHDLNLSGWWWILTVVPLLFLKQMFSFTELTHPDTLFWISNFVSLVSGVFSLCVTFWPGSLGSNKYGEPPFPRSNFLGDVMGIR